MNRVVSVRVLISKFAEIPIEEEDSGDEGQPVSKTRSKKNVSRSQYSKSARG